MSKKLEELLDLPDSKEIIQQEKARNKQEVVKQQNDTLRDIAEMDKISAALPQVRGLGELADNELGEVADKAMEAYEDLMDLGMNVESRYSGRVFEVAGQMLKTNLDAKVAKLDKKLKMVELQLKKEKLDKANKLYSQAFTKLEKALKKDRKNPDILNYMGFTSRKTGNFEIAEKFYLQGLSINPNHNGINEYLGELYVQTNRMDKANERLEVLKSCNCKEYGELELIIKTKGSKVY